MAFYSSDNCITATVQQDHPDRWSNLLTIAYRMILTLLVLLLLSSDPAYAQSQYFNKIEPTDEQFLLLDVRTTQLIIIEGATAYQVEQQILLPVTSIVQLLEMNIQSDASQGIITFNKQGTEYRIDLNNDQSMALMTADTAPIYWTDIESELLVSHLLIEALLGAKFDFSMSQLSATIIDQIAPFPLELRLIREKRRAKTAGITGEKVKDDKIQTVFADEFLLDTYRFMSPPKANINLDVTSQKNDFIGSETQYNSSIQSFSDLFYHYTQLTLNKRDGGEIASNLTFSRYQASPYETLWLGANRYSFGDVFGKADDLTRANQAGMGLSINRRPLNFSSKFGTVTIEDMASPGWEVELYRGGVLLETSTVPEDGRYVFTDIETLFGVNRFTIKLYGPYGEQEVHYKNIRINSTTLKSGEYGYDAYILDNGRKVLDGINGKDATAFKPDNFGFDWDYGLTDSLNLGVSLTRKKSAANEDLDFIGTNMQTSIPGALFNLSLSHQLNEGYAGTLSVLGQLGESTSYQLGYERFQNHDVEGITSTDRENISGSINGSLAGVFYNNIAGYSTTDQNESIDVSNRLAASVGPLSLSHVTSYRQLTFNNIAVRPLETLTGELSTSGQLAKDLRFSGSILYDMKDSGNIDKLRLSASYRLSEQMNLVSQFEYLPDQTNDWRFNSSLSWSTKNTTFFSSVNYDAEDSWSVSLGLKFSLGYDHHNNNWLISSRNMASTGTLDINSYLDQNNNKILDEGDIALPGVAFGNIKQWEDIRSGDSGQAILPFVSTFRPTNFNARWADGVSPTTKSYAVYTHPGSFISAQIPFSVKTTITGFVLFDDVSGEPWDSVTVKLVNPKDDVTSTTTTDQDGFYEFVNINPGEYQVVIDSQALQSRTLHSNPGMLRLVTPPAGGLIEVGVFAAIPVSVAVTEAVRTIELTEENYEPIEEVQTFLAKIRQADQPPVDQAAQITLQGEKPDDGNQLDNPQQAAIRPEEITVAGPNNQDSASPDTGLTLANADISTLKPQVPIAEPLLKKTTVISPEAIKAKVKRATVKASQNTSAQLQPSQANWALQFAVLSTASVSQDTILQLKQAGVTATRYFDKDIMAYRILSGPFADRDQAKTVSATLKQQGIDSFSRPWPATQQATQQATPIDTHPAQADTEQVIATAQPSAPLATSGFSIQMMVAKTQHSIDVLLANKLLGQDLYQIKKDVNGESLNVLLKGHYTTREQAEQAVSALPAQWRSKTWIRPIAQVIN